MTKPKLDFPFDKSNIDLSAARPAKVYSLRCTWCKQTKTIRSNTKMGRRKKYCSDKCAKEAFDDYYKKYISTPEFRKLRRKKYWDKRRAEQKKQDGV